ncbi:MAG: AarF/UbiB family protein [Myxococcota bacterium]
MTWVDWVALLLVPVRIAWSAVVFSLALAAAICSWLCRGPQVGARLVDHFVRGVGGSPIKLCQWLSTRQDLIGPSWAEAFKRLLDGVNAPPRWLLRLMIRRGAKRLGLEIAKIHFPPLGSGSVACALKVDLADGRPVVFKVARLGYRLVARTDRFLYLALGYCIHPFMPFVNVPQQLGRFARRAIEQGDMLVERANLEALASAVTRHAGVKVPKVLGATHDVCAMELVAEAHPLGSGADDRGPAVAVVRSLLAQVFREEVLHCDAHPANVLVTGDGTAWFIDGGLAERLTPPERERLVMGIGGLLGLDAAALAAALIAAAPKPPKLEPPKRAIFEEELRGFAQRAGEAIKNPDFRLTRLVIELFDILRRFKIGADPNLVMANTALAIAESYTSLAKVDVRFEAMAAMRPLPK